MSPRARPLATVRASAIIGSLSVFISPRIRTRSAPLEGCYGSSSTPDCGGPGRRLLVTLVRSLAGTRQRLAPATPTDPANHATTHTAATITTAWITAPSSHDATAASVSSSSRHRRTCVSRAATRGRALGDAVASRTDVRRWPFRPSQVPLQPAERVRDESGQPPMCGEHPSQGMEQSACASARRLQSLAPAAPSWLLLLPRSRSTSIAASAVAVPLARRLAPGVEALAPRAYCRHPAAIPRPAGTHLGDLGSARSPRGQTTTEPRRRCTGPSKSKQAHIHILRAALPFLPRSDSTARWRRRMSPLLDSVPGEALRAICRREAVELRPALDDWGCEGSGRPVAHAPRWPQGT